MFRVGFVTLTPNPQNGGLGEARKRPHHDKVTVHGEESKITCRKIPKISPAYVFQGPFSRGLFCMGLYSEGFMYGGKFEFQNRLG